PNPCGPAIYCGPTGLDERSERRRSGWGVGAGIGHSLPIDTGALPLRDTALHGGYDFASFEARGREYTYRAHRFGVGLSTGLPFGVGFDVEGAYTYRPFRHASTYPDPPVAAGVPPNGVPYTLSGVRRREEMFEVETELSRPVTDVVSVSARWRYVDNDSNTKVFDYEHHVLGFYVHLGFGREL
ncbi:MAG: hypothetical protein ACQGVC_03020, partial [Myxococcota bacterium]